MLSLPDPASRGAYHPRGPYRSRCIAIDFDGTLHEYGDGRWPPGNVNVSLIHEAHERELAVCILTANSVEHVAAELRRYRVDAAADLYGAHESWHNAQTVLVTQRKLANVIVILDDRALHYEYGQPTGPVWAELDRRRPWPVA